MVIIDKKTNKATHLGVVSYVTREGCSVGKPSAYTRTYKYLDWIHKKTNITIKN